MRALPVLTCLLIAVGVAPAASADVWHAKDPRHDSEAITHYAQPAPCGTDEATDDDEPLTDIRGLAVDHGPDTIALTLSMDRVKRGGEFTSGSYLLRLRVPGGDRWSVRVSGQGSGEPLFVGLLRDPDPDECGRVVFASGPKSCSGLKGRTDPRLDRVVVSLPRECVGNPGWVRVGADASLFVFSDNHGSYAISRDTWSPDGASEPGTYGPRVRS